MTKAAGITELVHSAPGRGRAWAVLALFIGLGATAASPALTLGDLQVQSSLGEPLSAIVQVDAAAGETLRRECFAPGADTAAVSGIPRTDDLRMVLVRQGNGGVLRLASQSPVREPLTQVVLQVRCPGLPRLTRAFVVLLDPAAIAAPPPRLIPTPRRASPRTGVVTGGDIAPGSQYVVRPGDTLSGIASRIAGRPAYSVWPLASRIKAQNPSAFENGRADALIAGSRLQMPLLGSLASSGTPDRVSRQRAAAPPIVAENKIAASAEPIRARTATSIPSSRAPVETPVLLGEPVGGTDLSYLVITMELSPLSRARLAERADQPAAAATPEPTTAATAPESAPEVRAETTPWYSKAWYWLLALLAMLAVGLLALLYRRRQPQAEPAAATAVASPWELGDEDATANAVENLEADEAPMLVEEPVAKVYDDFTGTFVEATPTEEMIPPVPKGADPEDDIQTHLMPTVEEPQAFEAEDGGLSLAATDQPKLEGLEERVSFTKRSNRNQDINVTTLEENENEPGEDGWVELDFEATQILEQDYLAEYAKTLKDKVKEQSEAAETELEADESDVLDDPLVAASELIEALDEDLLTAEMMELDEPSSPDATSELPAVYNAASEDDEDPTASVTTLELEADDNVVAIDQAKKSLEDDDADEPARERGKKS